MRKKLMLGNNFEKSPKLAIAFNLKKEIPVKITRTKKNQIWNGVSKIASRTVKLGAIFEKIIPPSDFEKCWATRRFVENIKPTRNLCCTFLCMYTYTAMSIVYTILFSIKWRLKKLDPTHHPPPTTQIKKNVFGVESEILTKYKRIKWTPKRKASHLLYSQGDKA